VGFIEGDAARKLAAASLSERRGQVVKDFVRYFGDEAADPTDYLEYS
jgi:monoamine oxidase